MGYGLVQWTPASKYLDWVKDGDPSTIDNNIARILYEVENNVQWIATDKYPMSFKEFTQSLESPTYLADVFIKNYERPADPDQPIRGEQAEKWYTFLSGIDPTPPTPTPSSSGKNWRYMIHRHINITYNRLPRLF